MGLDPDSNYLTLWIIFLTFWGGGGGGGGDQLTPKHMPNYPACKELTLKAPIKTAADDKFGYFLPIFNKNKV